MKGCRLMNNWCELKYITIGSNKEPIENINYKDILMYIDDALTMGFEFKVENHSIYYRG